MSTLVLAVAPLPKVESALAELKQDGEIVEQEFSLASTKGYQSKSASSSLTIDCSMLSEDQAFDFSSYSRVILIQNSSSVISYVNVYRFLRRNGVNEFGIKCKGNSLLNTCLDKVFGLLTNHDNRDCDDVIWISPGSIKQRKELAQIYYGQVLPGDWDLEVQDFEHSVSFFSSLAARVNSGIEWQQTEYYKDVLASLQRGESRFGLSSVEQLEQHCESMDALYLSMQTSGWQQEKGADYVTINIGRNGQLLFNDGRHRLSCAKLLGLEKIPVKVSVRHTEWVAFKSEISAFANEFYSGKVYAKITHPDLQCVEYTQDENRLDTIVKHMDEQSQTVLDIGSHWGFFCSSLEGLGKQCTAVEADVSNFYFLNKLKIASGHKFKAVNASIFDFVKPGAEYDAVLALNIFHHFLKTEERYAMLVKMLGDLQAGEIFLQTHDPKEPQMEGSFMNPDGDDFARLVGELSGLGKVELIEKFSLGRNLYKLSR